MKLSQVCTGLVHAGRFYGFFRPIVICSDIMIEMVKYEICLLISVLNHISHVDNSGKKLR